MKIVICGLSITSSWGNGHATTYRALVRALNARGHDIVFFERDLEWYSSNRDMPQPPFCRVHIYDGWAELQPLLRRELDDAEIGMVGSYFPDSTEAIDTVLGSNAAVKVFYDIDTPITVSKLRNGDAEYLTREQLRGFDIYFSFTGGPMLGELAEKFGARCAVPLYCSFDPDRYRISEPDDRFRCDLSYMGTYAADRQARLEELLCKPAGKLPDSRFVVAGPQYPADVFWPKNIQRITHLEPRLHPPFYSSSRFTLNLTRKDMIEAGYSPSVRLFEAAGCGAAIISDAWSGIETFFTPGTEILLADSSSAIVTILTELSQEQVDRIGHCAQERVLAEHTAEKRAIQFEDFVGVKTLARQCA